MNENENVSTRLLACLGRYPFGELQLSVPTAEMAHVELLRNYLASCPGGQRPGVVTLNVIGEERPVEQVVAALQHINVSLTGF